MKILLIAGHGDGDSGACGNGYREADLTREVVALLAPKLKNMCSVEIADTSKNWFEFLKSHSYNFKPYDYAEYGKYGNYDVYEASLPESQDAFNMDTDYRLSKLELGL